MLHRITLYAAASALPVALLSFPAAAQHTMQGVPGMQGMAGHKHQPAAKKPATKKRSPKKPAHRNSRAAATGKHAAHKSASSPAAAHADHAVGADHATMDHGSMAEHQMPQPTPSEPVDHSAMHDDSAPQRPSASVGAEAPSTDHQAIDHRPIDDQAMGHEGSGDQGTHQGVTGAFRPYPAQRDSSGTAWQPDASEHEGVMIRSGDWTLMGHGLLNLVYDHQSGRRSDDKAFASGMLMGMASRPVGNGTLQFRAMLSPDALMGKRGYPLLLASGETANGVDRLIDRQHPHDLFMELSASVAQNVGPKSSLFVYAGLPGEPAFGPPAFMHREAILDSPEAPISHHWLDSTHISFGVVTAGVVVDRVKLEVSRFNGREPDQHRWNIETGPLDSTSVRVSWNPMRTLALQGSWGHFTDPEQLEPGVDQKRWSASALYADEIAPGWKLAGTLAWGRKTVDGHKDDAYVAEASLKHGAWTMFGRGEITENRELIEEEHSEAFHVGKLSIGAVRDVPLASRFSLGIGGLLAVNFVPDALASRYGSHDPIGAMGFVRLKIE
jgi:hypothetical protein